MPELHVIDGDKDIADSDFSSFHTYEQPEDIEFGLPPNLYVGLATGLVGALAGVLSLVIYFQFWDPAPYISPQWLFFAYLGGVVGFFLRMEKPLTDWDALSDE